MTGLLDNIYILCISTKCVNKEEKKGKNGTSTGKYCKLCQQMNVTHTHDDKIHMTRF